MMTGLGEMTLGAWVWMGIWIGGLFAMVWFLVRGSGNDRRADDPDEILRARFARGEINGIEYQQAWQTLHSDKETTMARGPRR